MKLVACMLRALTKTSQSMYLCLFMLLFQLCAARGVDAITGTCAAGRCDLELYASTVSVYMVYVAASMTRVVDRQFAVGHVVLQLRVALGSRVDFGESQYHPTALIAVASRVLRRAVYRYMDDGRKHLVRNISDGRGGLSSLYARLFLPRHSPTSYPHLQANAELLSSYSNHIGHFLLLGLTSIPS